MNDLQADESAVDASAMLYGLLSLAFSYPDDDLLDGLANGELISALENSSDALTTAAARTAIADFLDTVTPYLHTLEGEQLQSDYIALFELNPAQPPLHLNAHLYEQGQPNPVPVYQRLIATYHEFGIEMRDAAGVEQPDHLNVQLEFLAWLYQLLGQSLRGESALARADIEDAIRAFRTELSWIQRWLPALEQRGGHPFYLPLGKLLQALLQDS